MAGGRRLQVRLRRRLRLATCSQTQTVRSGETRTATELVTLLATKTARLWQLDVALAWLFLWAGVGDGEGQQIVDVGLEKSEFYSG